MLRQSPSPRPSAIRDCRFFVSRFLLAMGKSPPFRRLAVETAATSGTKPACAGSLPRLVSGWPVGAGRLRAFRRREFIRRPQHGVYRQSNPGEGASFRFWSSSRRRCSRPANSTNYPAALMPSPGWERLCSPMNWRTVIGEQPSELANSGTCPQFSVDFLNNFGTSARRGCERNMDNPTSDRSPTADRPPPPPRTHDKCTAPGLYISTCGCEDRVTITATTYFPSCIKCRKDVTWLLQRQP